MPCRGIPLYKKNIITQSLLWQVHPGGLAGGGDHDEGLLQLDLACHCELCGPLPGSAFSAQSPPPAFGHSVHGDLHKVGVSDLQYDDICIVMFCFSNFFDGGFLGKKM